MAARSKTISGHEPLSPRERLARLLEASAGRAPHTPAERLRALLTELEIRVANMAGTGGEVLRIPSLMDQAQEALEHLAQTGMDVHPERTRFENIQNQLRSRAALFIREAREGGGLRRARAERPSPPRSEQWWWYLDREVTRERRRRLVRWLAVSLTIGAILVALGWFIQSRLPRNPRLRRIIDLQTSLDVALSNGDFARAIPVLKELRQLDPKDPTYAVQLGVLYELSGHSRQAQQQFEDARRLAGEGTFYKLRASTYLQLGNVDKGLADARKAVALLPNDPEAYLYLGGAYEAKGDRRPALQAYEQGAKLAEEQKNDQLLVIFRVRMAYLLQRPPGVTQGNPPGKGNEK